MMMISALAASASHRGAFYQCAPSPELMLARRKTWAPNRHPGITLVLDCGSRFPTPCKQFSRE